MPFWAVNLMLLLNTRLETTCRISYVECKSACFIIMWEFKVKDEQGWPASLLVRHKRTLLLYT